METWIILFIINRLLSSTCPVTSPIGTLLGYVSIIAIIVFVGLTFWIAPDWWYGLVSIGIYLGVPFIVPKINSCTISNAMWVYSMIGSHANFIIVVLMYLSLFGIM